MIEYLLGAFVFAFLATALLFAKERRLRRYLELDLVKRSEIVDALKTRVKLLEELTTNLAYRNEQLEPGARLLGDESEMGLQDCKRDSQPKLRAVGKDE